MAQTGASAPASSSQESNTHGAPLVPSTRENRKADLVDEARAKKGPVRVDAAFEQQAFYSRFLPSTALFRPVPREALACCCAMDDSRMKAHISALLLNAEAETDEDRDERRCSDAPPRRDKADQPG
jgi:hypothetical protein